MRTHSTREYLRTLGWLLYLLAFLTVSSALLEVVVSAWPLHPSQLQWRLGAAGLAAQGVLITVLGFYMALVAAVMREQRFGLALLGVLGGVATAILLALTLLFALDAVQAYHAVRPAFAQRVMLTNLRVVSLDLMGAAMMLVHAVLCFRARGWLRHPERGEVAVLVGRSGERS